MVMRSMCNFRIVGRNEKEVGGRVLVKAEKGVAETSGG
jgi:hypothetical protein